MNEAAVLAGKGLTERAACRRLRLLARRVPADQCIVELGAYKGRTTAWLALGASEGLGARVVSVDPWGQVDVPGYDSKWEGGYATGAYSEARAEFDEHMRATGAAVTVLQGTAEAIGRQWFGDQVGLLWHDAQHTAEAVQADLEAWLPHMAEHSTIVCHDACQAAFGVRQGAARALGTGWGVGVVHRWKKKPDRRGTITFTR